MNLDELSPNNPVAIIYHTIKVQLAADTIGEYESEEERNYYENPSAENFAALLRVSH